jgi:nicotinamidase-related amidase
MQREPTRMIHICVDVQAMFATDTDWHTPWLPKVLPAIEILVERDPSRTIFTRFIPPARMEDAAGAWRDYYRRWPNMTRQRLPEAMLEVVPALRRHIPPARLLDKAIYSPWLLSGLHRTLQREGVDTLVITGGETDICVLATVLGAIDLGYRVLLPTDAVFGSADQTHDATLTLYRSRFGQQLTACTAQELLDNWADIV